MQSSRPRRTTSFCFLAPSSTSCMFRRLGSSQKPLRSTPSPRFHTPTTMIQRPDHDGPPNLSAYFEKQAKPPSPVGQPVTLGTGRALLKNNRHDVIETCLAALSAARQSLPSQPQLVQCTFSLDVDADTVARTLTQQVKVPILGRSINKKDSSGTIEVLLLSSEHESGISFASATTDVMAGEEVASKRSAVAAANSALDGLKSRESCTFMIFGHTPGEDDAVRAGLNEALPGVIAYGGPAVGNDVNGDGWTLLANDLIHNGSQNDSRTVHVAAVPGSLSFLYSAVIKSWAQPAFVEPPSYMTPSYVDDPQLDLLTAIRHNDWDKYVWCIEDQGVDVNTTWTNKQNQSPLLAACARGRTEMVKHLLDNGADVGHRNDGGFNAIMYTKMLSEYSEAFVSNQLKMLEDAGADIQLMQ